MNFARRKKIFSGLAVASFLLIGVFLFRFTMMPHPPKIERATYFSYSVNEITALKTIFPTGDMTLHELLAWDDKLFQLVASHQYPDTTASRIYAYVLIAQHDAATLSYNTYGTYKGNVTSVSKEVLCLLVPDNCTALTEDIRIGGFPAEDAYGKALSDIVLKKVAARIDEEHARRDSYPGIFSSDAIGVETAGWKLWTLPDRTQFRATPRIVEVNKLTEESATRAPSLTDEQKQAVASFTGGPGTKTSAGLWLEIAGVMLAKERAPLERALTMRSDLACALADGVIMTFDSKYNVGNSAPFSPDKHIALVTTPEYPSYPGLQATLAGVAEQVIGYYAPDSDVFLARYVNNAKNATNWAGINFAIDNEEGYSVGKKIGTVAIEALHAQEKK